MRYSFKTSTTLKEKDRGKWWMDKNLVKPIELEASKLCEALENYREIVNDGYDVQISKNAIQKKTKYVHGYKAWGALKTNRLCNNRLYIF